MFRAIVLAATEYYATLRTEDADTGAALELEMTVTGGTRQQAAKAFMGLLSRVAAFTEEDLDGQIWAMRADAWDAAKVSSFVAGRNK